MRCLCLAAQVWEKASKAAASRTLADARALDTIAYHDTNDDKVVSETELWAALYSWNVVRRVVVERARLLTRGTSAKELLAFEEALNVFRRPGVGHGVGGTFDPKALDIAGTRNELKQMLAAGSGRAGRPLPPITSSADVSEYFWSSNGEQENQWGPEIRDDGIMQQLGHSGGAGGAIGTGSAQEETDMEEEGEYLEEDNEEERREDENHDEL